MTNASTFIVEENTGAGGTGATAIVFKYAEASTAGSDVYLAVQSATVGGVTTSTRNNMTWVIEIDASQLSDGSPYLNVNFSSGATIQIGAVAVLSGLRYAEDISLSAID